MVTTSNLATVQNIYAYFGQGNIPGILACLSENAIWNHQGNPAVIPFAGLYQGKANIIRFFEILGRTTQFASFVPKNFRESGNQVINEIDMMATALTTGKQMQSTVTFTWTFDEQGKVSHWKNEGGLEALEMAFR